MNNMDYNGWLNWVETTYASNTAMRSVFMKLLDAWQMDRISSQAKLESAKEAINRAINDRSDTYKILYEALEQLEVE